MTRTALWLAFSLLLAAPAGGENRWFEQGRETVRRARALGPAAGRAKNIVLFLGDGMGLTTVTAARILEGQLQGRPGEENLLASEELPHLCLVKT